MIQEDLPQEQEDNKHDPEAKKKALKHHSARYNERFGTNHRIEESTSTTRMFSSASKDQQFPNADLPKKVTKTGNITIVVDMLLTGFDSKYLQHALHQTRISSTRANPGLQSQKPRADDSKPYGHILDFRGQQKEVDAAIALFSGAKADQRAKSGSSTRAPSSSTSSRSRGAGSNVS